MSAREMFEELGYESDEENENYVDLDVKNNDYFLTQGIENQHGQGGHLFSNDPNIMGWLFN